MITPQISSQAVSFRNGRHLDHVIILYKSIYCNYLNFHISKIVMQQVIQSIEQLH